MRTNGYLKYRIPDPICECDSAEAQDEFDEDGELVEGATLGESTDETSNEWSDCIPCMIQTQTRDVQGTYGDGHYTRHACIVLLERGNEFRSDRIQLTRGESYLGEFVINNMQNVSLDRIKIDAEKCR